MRIAITGATGLLGRNLLFEFLKQHLNDPDPLEVFVLGRGKSGQSLSQRVANITLLDGIHYCALDTSRQSLQEYCTSTLRYIEIDHLSDNLGIDDYHLSVMKSRSFDFFFHIAALTDFRDSPGVVRRLRQSNLDLTRRVLLLAAALNVREFDFVSSAYCCGKTTGTIYPNYVNSGEFRNPYEESKLQAELMVRAFAQQAKMRHRIFRPSTLAGRLIEPALGSTPKFDVFYACAAFFLFAKLSMMNDDADPWHTCHDLDLRLCYDPTGGLNIVPADYAAKLMYQICVQQDSGDSYHLANERDTPNALYVPLMLETVGVTVSDVVNHVPSRMKNSLETLYYQRGVGKLYTPYVVSPGPMTFDTESSETARRQGGLVCPRVDRESFLTLMAYARRHNFGLRVRNNAALGDAQAFCAEDG